MPRFRHEATSFIPLHSTIRILKNAWNDLVKLSCHDSLLDSHHLWFVRVSPKKIMLRVGANDFSRFFRLCEFLENWPKSGLLKKVSAIFSAINSLSLPFSRHSSKLIASNEIGPLAKFMGYKLPIFTHLLTYFRPKPNLCLWTPKAFHNKTWNYTIQDAISSSQIANCVIWGRSQKPPPKKHHQKPKTQNKRR